MKNITKITGITLLIVALAVPAFAQRQARGKGLPQKGIQNVQERLANLTPEQQEKLEELKALHEKFRDETADTRNEMAKKIIDLKAVLESDDPDVNDAKAIQKDISKLQAKFSEARLELIIEAKKLAPDKPFGRSFGARQSMSGMRGGMGFRGTGPAGPGSMGPGSMRPGM